MGRSTRKNPTTTDRASTTVKPMSGSKLGDAASKQLALLGKQGGNHALDARLKQGAGMRDDLLQFICQRLKAMHEVQGFEKLEMGREREWFRPVARGQAGYHLPDPTRWHEAAHLFQRAAQAMCNGNLGQGAALLDQAMEAERAAYNSLPQMVMQHLDRVTKDPDEAPATLAHVPSTGACPSCAMPKDIRYADLILNVQDVMEETPPLNRRRGNAWWLEEDEEEEEEEEDE